MFAAISGAVSLGILAGCSTRQYGLSASDETARYLQNARGRYVIPGSASDPWGPYIHEASRRFDMPEQWIRALMRQESGGNLYRNGRLITSSAGAMGLMQVMPGTYRELRARHNLGYDPFDPHDNIMAGVGYMREMYDMYGSPGFLAAYNAGPNRLDDYLANQRGLPDETRRYVAAIGPSLRTTAPRVHSPAERYAMNQLPLYIPPGPRYGYGQVQVPTVQLASASTYRAPVFTQAPAQPTYAPPVPVQQPRTVVAFAQPPRPVYTAPAIPAPRALAWEAPKPAAAPAQTYAPPPPRQVQVARVEEDDPPPVRRHVTTRAHHGETKVALAISPTPPQRRGHGLHLISSAVAAEAVPIRRAGKAHVVPVSYASRAHAPVVAGPKWKFRASGPVQAPPACHKNSRGKTVCGPQSL